MPRPSFRRAVLLASGALLLAGAALAADPTPIAVDFTPTPAPATEAEMIRPYTASAAVVRYSDGTTRSYPLSYNVLFRTGDKLGGRGAAVVTDRTGKPIMAVAPEGGATVKGPFYANSPDANSLIATKNGPRLITHFEYQPGGIDINGKEINLYRQLPMLMTDATLRQDATSGKLTATSVANVDFAGTNGLWVPCAGTLTPWNTHLGGEEYEPDARHFETRPLEAMNLYLGTPGKTAAQGGANPYRYGHLVEVAIKNGKAVPTKHYAAGRLAFELADVQEDGRTLYYGDDGRDVVRFMFIADRVGDLSAGTLYAAKWLQRDAAVGGSADLKWIRLGHAQSAEVAALVDKGIRFSDIFDVADRPTAGFTPVFVYLGAQAKDRNEREYLKLKPGMEKAAAFLESRRYAAYLGATTEFTKMEGVTHDPAKRRLYLAMSYVEQGMLDGKNGDRPQDDIRLDGDPADHACGIVYESRMTHGQRDTDGQPIASDWVAADMKALIVGAKAGPGSHPLDKCATDKVANPDNLKFSAALRTLFIGEDSGNHINNFVWAYNVDSGKLTRVFSAPIGAENTGLAITGNLKGHAYIFTNIQHPGAAEDLEKYPPAIKVEMRKKVDQRGLVGYIGGLPGLP